MRLSPRLLFSVIPLFMRAPMKFKILIGIAVIGFFGWSYLNKAKTGLGNSAQQPAPLSQGQQP